MGYFIEKERVEVGQGNQIEVDYASDEFRKFKKNYDEQFGGGGRGLRADVVYKDIKVAEEKERLANRGIYVRSGHLCQGW